jgi:hypothetical protein
LTRCTSYDGRSSSDHSTFPTIPHARLFPLLLKRAADSDPRAANVASADVESRLPLGFPIGRQSKKTPDRRTESAC